ncbi:MAG: ATPase [Parcubacteria group bacterium]|nr:ATPase [Parcubacteria group bacterium]
MDRISVVGISGAGKSTLSNKLGKKLNLPVFHLDKYFWDVGWKKRYEIKEEFTAVVNGFANQDKWIIDGNYTSSNLDLRFEKADTIIFLDLPKYRCLWRVFIRVFDRKQPFDKTEGVKQKADWALVQWILTYKTDEIRTRVAKHKKEDKNVFVVRNNREINGLLEKLGNMQ